MVENISFGEKSYKESIDKIMATVYHRLAFLDTKVDSLGFTKYKGIYVYDNVKLKKFILKRANRVVATELVTFGNDIAKKLKKVHLYYYH